MVIGKTTINNYTVTYTRPYKMNKLTSSILVIIFFLITVFTQYYSVKTEYKNITISTVLKYYPDLVLEEDNSKYLSNGVWYYRLKGIHKGMKQPYLVVAKFNKNTKEVSYSIESMYAMKVTGKLHNHLLNYTGLHLLK